MDNHYFLGESGEIGSSMAVKKKMVVVVWHSGLLK